MSNVIQKTSLLDRDFSQETLETTWNHFPSCWSLKEIEKALQKMFQPTWDSWLVQRTVKNRFLRQIPSWNPTDHDYFNSHRDTIPNKNCKKLKRIKKENAVNNEWINGAFWEASFLMLMKLFTSFVFLAFLSKVFRARIWRRGAKKQLFANWNWIL